MSVSNIYWHAFTVQPRKEFVVREILARRGIASFVPIETKLVRATPRCRRRVPRQFPLCPSYIFIPFVEGDWQTWETVRNLRHGINSVVAVAGRPARIDPEGMAHLIKLSGQQLVGGCERVFRVDDSVRIAAGPLQGFEGVVESAKKGRAIIELLKSGRVVDLPMSSLESTDMPVAEQPYLFGQNRKVPDVTIAEVREHADSQIRLSVPA